MALDNHYEPQKEEKALYDFWLKEGIFTADAKSTAPKYCIILPPPNVTGVLHMGHALTCTLEDILVRRKRMQGFNTLWVPGTDHAGIATQMVVERKLLKEEKKTRHEIGREAFLKKVWEWKEQSQGTILHQLKLIGCSLDWTRLAFTLDEGVSEAVRECFVRLYQEKLIYREMAITQWCPRCRTALSDLEVKAKEVKGKFWHIRYLKKGSPGEALIVATTRPETLLGDTAVAIHPEDERFASFHGAQVMVPLVDRAVPVICDTYVEKAFGTGALKITPGHDPNDYLIGKKHNLPVLTIFDDGAHVNEVAPSYQGLSREKAREKVLADLQAKNLLVKEEDHLHNVGHCDRCGTVVEPKVGAQWFVKAEILAREAIRVVETKEIRIVPEEWEKTYFEWMRNIRPWCISRQLWWGHRIPVWYCVDCQAENVATQTPAACEKCGSKKLKQDEDVLDTWFSSGLWPISTLGWPKATEDLKAFYPNDVLETGFDILFFWVARMIMMGIKMTGKIPFHTVYLHPMVRDEAGQKMSKTKGNVVDPLEIIERKGADALRFFLAWNAYHGRDLRVSDDGVEGCRNFINKMWNATRFMEKNLGEVVTERKPDTEDPINQWILTRFEETKAKVNTALDGYRFFEAAQAIYHFLWNEYCDWYIELIKPKEEMEKRQKRADSVPFEVLDETLRLLHPFMPFVTEKIWQTLTIRNQKVRSISLAGYPEASGKTYPAVAGRIDDMIRLIEEVRTLRGLYQIPGTAEVELVVVPLRADYDLTMVKGYSELLSRMTKSKRIAFQLEPASEKTHLAVFTKAFRIYFPKASLPDLTQEISRRKKELEEKKVALGRAEEKLLNERFMQSAPENVRLGVVKQRDDLKQEVEAIEKYLKGVGV